MVSIRPTAPAVSLFGAWSTGAAARDAGCTQANSTQAASLLALRSAYRAGLAITH